MTILLIAAFAKRVPRSQRIQFYRLSNNDLNFIHTSIFNELLLTAFGLVLHFKLEHVTRLMLLSEFTTITELAYESSSQGSAFSL
jgi:hypothetical protein